MILRPFPKMHLLRSETSPQTSYRVCRIVEQTCDIAGFDFPIHRKSS
jgi:hypothetical protein